MNTLSINPEFIHKYISPVRKIASKVPHVASLEITTRCQLDCIYCTRDKDNPKDLSIDKLEDLIGQVKNVKKFIICGMGESFCSPNIYETIWKLKDYKITIITNGAIPIDFEKLNREGNVDILVFSIDATTEDKIESICRKYNFTALKDNLVKLMKYPNIVGIINTTINEVNIDEMPLLIKFAAEHHLQAVNYGLPIGNEEFVSANKDLINKRMKEATKLAKENHIILNNFYRLNCNTSGSIVPNIRISGDVFPCCNGMDEDVKVGNIYESSLEDIWQKKGLTLIHDQEFCLECKLTKNLRWVVE